MSKHGHTDRGDDDEGQERDFPTPEGPMELGTCPMEQGWIAIPPEPGSFAPGRGIKTRPEDLADLEEWR